MCGDNPMCSCTVVTMSLTALQAKLMMALLETITFCNRAWQSWLECSKPISQAPWSFHRSATMTIKSTIQPLSRHKSPSTILSFTIFGLEISLETRSWLRIEPFTRPWWTVGTTERMCLRISQFWPSTVCIMWQTTTLQTSFRSTSAS